MALHCVLIGSRASLRLAFVRPSTDLPGYRVNIVYKPNQPSHLWRTRSVSAALPGQATTHQTYRNPKIRRWQHLAQLRHNMAQLRLE